VCFVAAAIQVLGFIGVARVGVITVWICLFLTIHSGKCHFVSPLRDFAHFIHCGRFFSGPHMDYHIRLPSFYCPSPVRTGFLSGLQCRCDIRRRSIVQYFPLGRYWADGRSTNILGDYTGENSPSSDHIIISLTPFGDILLCRCFVLRNWPATRSRKVRLIGLAHAPQ
jgi:hypothetical protein